MRVIWSKGQGVSQLGRRVDDEVEVHTVLGATHVGHSVTSQVQNGWRTNRETKDLGAVFRERDRCDEVERGRTCLLPCKRTFSDCLALVGEGSPCEPWDPRWRAAASGKAEEDRVEGAEGCSWWRKG